MEQYQKTELLNITEGRTEFDSGMDRYCYYRAGGKAEAICRAESAGVLVQLVSYLRQEGLPFLAVGRGSNILVTDKGIRGAVIILGKGLAGIRKLKNNRITAGGGLSVASMLHYCAKEGLSGLEFMAGIPGTVGGAAVMNAGAHGHEICEHIEKVRIVKGSGKKDVLEKADIVFSYRGSSIPWDSVLYRVNLCVEKESPVRVKSRIKDYLAKRSETQPLDLPSCGSVFRNPAGDYAGRLIEKAGLKGKRVGAAMISPKHANWIVNTGGATASDILTLIKLVQSSVKERFGTDLVPEVRVVGE